MDKIGRVRICDKIDVSLREKTGEESGPLISNVYMYPSSSALLNDLVISARKAA